MPRRPTVAVDLDGVLAVNEEWKGPEHFGPLIVGAREFLASVRRMADVTIHTCRLTPREGDDAARLEALVRDWLLANDLGHDRLWTGPGKPPAKAYVDDRGVACRPEEGGFVARAEYAHALAAVARLCGKELRDYKP